MKIGSLCSGLGGLDLGVQAVLGGTVAWHVEYDPAPSRILAHHWPHIPNHGDVKTTDWHAVEPVDVLTAGYPCQPFSHAGNRKGSDDPRHLWPDCARAIGHLRPRLAVLENVRGHVSLGLDAVIGDLSELGYDARWGVVRASDAGAPHGRARIFIVAHPAGEGWEGRGQQPSGWPVAADGGAPAAHPGGIRREQGRSAGPGEATGGRPCGEPSGRGLFPTPRATDGHKGGPNQRGSSGDLMLPSAVVQLVPTPLASDAGPRGGTTGFGLRDWSRALAIEAQRLLDTPSVADALGGHLTRSGDRSDELLLPGQAKAMHGQRWGVYTDAIARWEALTRPAPPPTQTSRKGTPQLSPAFSEWLMGLPAGHVTDVPGLSRNAQLKALGNGVVPQQAALALTLLLDHLAGAGAA